MVKKNIQEFGIALRPIQGQERHYVNLLKQNTFLFDGVGVRETEGMLTYLHSIGDSQTFNDLLGLLSHELIFDSESIHTISKGTINSDESFRVEKLPRVQVSRDMLAANPNFFSDYGLLQALVDNDSAPESVKYEVEARMTTLFWNTINHDKNQIFFPLTPFNSVKLNTAKLNVQKVILEHIPIPHPETPISHITDFKLNPDNANRLFALRSLINRLGNSKYSEKEIIQELDYLYREYETSLKRSKIKFIYGLFEALLSFAFPKHLVTSKILGSLIKFRSSSLNLTISEQSAPGREISYLYRLEKQFAPAK